MGNPTRKRELRFKRLVATLALLGVTGGLGWATLMFYRGRAMAPVASAPAPVRSASPNTIIDPLAPDRPVLLDPSVRPLASGSWVTARPGFQFSRPPSERGGVNPCALPEVDTSALEPWSNVAKGRFSAPRVGALDASGRFDLVIHLFGDELARREFALSRQSFVLYSLTLEPGENYAALFSGSGFYGQIIEQLEQVLGKSRSTPARVRNVALSAWSAGYMGVMATLAQPEAKNVDAIVLIDGMHGPRDALEHQLAPFVDYARRAAAGERFMLVTHSSIDPPDFASTTESAHHLLSALGARPQAVHRNDRFGLELVEFFTRNDFHVRGYAGNDKADHCAQVALLRDAYAALGRRWGR
jgi:hypothetical protein